MKIAASLLASDFSRLGEETESVSAADFLHIDVMDGHFVPNISVGIPVVRALKRISPIPLDVHLMISEPERYAEAFIKAGADILCCHLETGNTENIIEKIKSLGAKPAVAIKPDTPAEAVFPYLESVYFVLVMTVEPGFGGQKLKKECLIKAEKIKQEIKRRNLPCLIECDGGINSDTLYEVSASGVDIAVMGTAIFNSENRKAFIEKTRRVTGKNGIS